MLSGRFIRSMAAAAWLAAAPACFAADERQSLEELRNTINNLLQALVEQGVMSREKAAQLVKAAQEKAAQDQAAAEAAAKATEKADEGAVRVPYVPQIVKDEIAKQVSEQVKPDVVADVVKEAKTEKWGIPGALADWLTRTRISGSVTLREEDVLYGKNNVPNFYLNYFGINQAGGIEKAGLNAFEDVNVNNVRFRGRARLAVDSDITDAVTAGVRIVTGNTSDLVSETQTFDGTAPYAFGVDEAYIRLDERNAQRFPWLSVVGGRFLNPYSTPTDLIFHKDLTFEGVALTGRYGFGDGSAEQSHLFFTLGAHSLQEIQLSPQDKWLTGAQLGANLRWGEGQRLHFDAAFFDYFNVTGRLNPLDGTLFNYTAPTFLRQGNTYFDISNNPNDASVNLFALAAQYRLADLNLTYTLPFAGYTFAVTADAVRNLGYNAARVEANVGHYVAPRTKGYQAEFSVGTPTVLTAGAWRALVGYRYLQRDAVIDAYTDSDFHWGGTDAHGYYLIGDFGVAKKIWVRVRYLSSNAIDGPTLGIDTVQLDLNTSF
jgi:hypothetical protein